MQGSIGQPNDLEWKSIQLPLINENSIASWWSHPTLKHKIDIGVLPLPKSLSDNFPFVLGDKAKLNDDIKILIGDEVMLWGFPKGLSKQLGLPIWKRGTIASEPELQFDNLPIFIVDAATREGMSGSPVVSRSHGLYQSMEGNYVMGDGITHKFLGVYSGRYASKDELDAQLGRVWHGSLINEIISGKTPAQTIHTT